MRADFIAAYRSLTGSMPYTAVAVTVLALGIGATTAIYSVVDTTLLRPLAFSESRRVVSLREHRPADDPFNRYAIAPQNFLDWDAEQKVFDQLAALSVRRLTSTSPTGEVEETIALEATADLFDVLRVAVLHGRPFGPDEEVAGRHRVVVMSHGYWRRTYGGDPAIIGKTLTLEGEPFEIVGVLPPVSFVPGAGETTDVVIPLVIPENERVRTPNVSSSYLSVIGRLRAGTSIEAARAEMDGIAARLRLAHPQWNGDSHVRVVPAVDDIVGDEWSNWLWMIFGGAACVLMIACVNVAVLQMTRASAREHEMSVRAALGGGRGRLFRQLLVENVLLTLVGAVAALVIAWVGVRVLRTTMVGLPRVGDAALDLRVLGVMALAATVCGLAVGVAPAWYLTSHRVARSLHDGARTVAGRAGRGLTRALVVAEVALALVLLVAASLWTRSLVAVLAIDPGFSTDRLLTAYLSAAAGPSRLGTSITVGVSTAASPPPVDVVPRFRDLVDRLNASPGVTHAAFVVGGTPLAGSIMRMGFSIENRTLGEDAAVVTRLVTEGYLSALGVAPTSGRTFAVADRTRAIPPAVVNAAFVREYFGAESPLGRTLALSGRDYEIIGVIPDVRGAQIERAIEPEVNALLSTGSRQRSGQILVRTAVDPLAVVPTITRAVAATFPGVPLRSVSTMDATLDQQTRWRRFDMWVASLFGALGLVIAAVGIYGTLAYGVARRTREIGVRMALGATPRAVVQLVSIETVAQLAVGLVLGSVGAAWVLARYHDQWFGVSLNDPWAFFIPTLVMLVAALAAAVVPVRRALVVDPADALRAE